MKTVDEWNMAFDLLWNNITSNRAPGLEKYEKSVFLTQAENALVKDYFSANENAFRQGFDDSIRRQSDYRNLIRSAAVSTYSPPAGEKFRTRAGTYYFLFPSDYLFVISEEVGVTKGTSHKYYTVVPLSRQEYARMMLRPYKYPPKDMMWRLITNVSESGSGDDFTSQPLIELIGKIPDGASIDYRISYVSRPSPIILEDLENGLEIDGESTAMPCLLPEHLHDEILARAVQIAKIAWIDNPGDKS